MFVNFFKRKKNKRKFIYFTKVKRDVLNYIFSFSLTNNYPPTYDEISKYFGFSRARAGAIIAELYKLGFITKGNSVHRNIRIDNYQKDIIENLQINREYPIKE